ncbi:MAG: sugar ABC transporter permease [Chloroflexota bacterium]|nr:sugar ABC transporter permease [Chloroflexota bacterium]PLS79658.1 MAG: sugar ABC transporter permease [Chloroflexota bacterium]
MTTVQLAKGLSQRRGRSLRKALPAYGFIAPAFLLYAVFFIYPFAISIYYSFVKWNGAGPKQFVGLANYQRLFSDKLLWQALGHNLVWVITGTLAPIVIALLLGALMWRGARGMLVFRTIYFLPVVLAEVVVAIIWNWIYHPLFGALNEMLSAVGLQSLTRGWLGDPQTALMAVLATAIWSYFGFAFVIIMAGLQDVNVDLVEAAMIDGANGWQRFVHVVIPELRHVLTMITAYTLIGGFNVFAIIFIMTQGGPGTATQVIGTYTYRKAFQESDIGYGATLSLVMTTISLIASYLFIRLRERSE